MAKIFISCDEASILSTRNQYNDLSCKEKFKHKLHICYCEKCKSFDKKARMFSETLNDLNWVKLSKTQKNAIKKRISEEMMK